MTDKIQLYTCPDCGDKVEKIYISICSSCRGEMCCHCCHQLPGLPGGLSSLCRGCHTWLCREIKRLLKEEQRVQKKEK